MTPLARSAVGILALMAPALAAPALAAEHAAPQSATMTIAQVLEGAREGQLVVVDAQAVQRLDEDEFLLRDATGEIRLDAWVEGRGAVPLPLGEPLRITGRFDNDLPEIYLQDFVAVPAAAPPVESTAPPASAPAPVAIAAASAEAEEEPAVEVRTIRDVRDNAPSYETVTIRATVESRRGDDNFLLRDDTGRIRVDSWDGRRDVQLPVGEVVVLTGTVDRTWLLRRKYLNLVSFEPVE